MLILPDAVSRYFITLLLSAAAFMLSYHDADILR